jgi:hypothetical protein
VGQGYRKEGVVFGSSRLQLLEPTPGNRIPYGQVPYCKGVTGTNLSGYAFPGNNTYTYGGFQSNQGTCQYLDAANAIPDVYSSGGAYIPTRVTLTEQAVLPDDGTCEGLPYPPPTCKFVATKPPELTYVNDPGTSPRRTSM